MKKQARYVLALLCFALPFYCFAQTINVKSADGSVDVVYTNPNDLQKAIDEASAGSTVTLSGGLFNNGNHIFISKEIHIVGAGFSLDSTVATGRTNLSNYIYILNGSDNSSFEGFELNGGFIGQGTTEIKNILIKKVKFFSLGISTITSGFYFFNLFITQCVFGSINLSNQRPTNVIISNNLIFEQLAYIGGYAIIQNNIFTTIINSNNRPLVSVNNSLIKNNIFDCVYVYNDYSPNANFGNIEYNNLINSSSWYPKQSSISVNNLANVALTDVFQNWFDNPTIYNFHQLDLRIKSNSVAKNAGTDGKDLGIYGGDGFRTKPSIPFIDYKEVAKQTNTQGQLPVNIRVKAQGNN